MKTLKVHVPDALAAEIEAESRRRRLSKSAIVRERLQRGELTPALDDIADLIGSVDDDLPADLSARTKHYLRLRGYGNKRRRPVAIWDGEPKRPSTDHDSVHDEP